MKPLKLLCAFFTLSLALSASGSAHGASPEPADLPAGEGKWMELFNGQDLTGWTAKITGYPAGENFGETFRVEDGLLKVRYDAYDTFNGRFGHLFWNTALSNYHLLIEYRFVGEQLAGGAGWAERNSGVMFHAQAPETMTENQDFPVSVEAQFLGGSGNGRPRPTNNLCTPGTDVTFEGRLYTPHCLNSNSPTFAGDQWVQVEIIVRGGGAITHIVNGDVVLEYSKPQISDPASHQRGSDAVTILDRGHIALQSESHSIDFRRVSIRRLSP